MDTTIAKEIMWQLGSQFSMMTGAKEFVAIEKGVQFRIGKNGSKANKVRITLNAKDLYDISFYQQHKTLRVERMIRMTADEISKYYEPKLLKEYTDVFCENLHSVFTEYTKLYTKLL